jgi:hypothetical protein
MKKIIEYNVIEANHLFKLGMLVNKLIKNGWQPLGGVSYTDQPSWNYIQAMVKYSEDHGTYAQGCSTGPR